MPARHRFHAGIASATVPVAPVTAQLSAQSNILACGQGTQLDWKSTDAVDTSISGIGEVPANGDRTASPTHDMTYVLTAKGPGGEATQSVTIKVDSTPTATLALSQPEVHFHKVGDRVVQQDSATLNWSASNANSANVEPLGSNAMTGSQKTMADPTQTTTGPVNEDVKYTITATNACGGTTTKTAVLHIVGSIDPPPSTALASLFFPTAYPTKRHPKVGLVTTEELTLTNIATQFKNFGLCEHNASLVVIGYADVRGPEKYNMALSQRRAALVRDYLISKGVPAADIKIRAEGKDKEMDKKSVEVLLSKSEEKPEKWMTKNEKATCLAYNRRADLVLEPTGQQSTMLYPMDTPNTHLVWQRPMPPLKKLEQAASTSTNVQQASSSNP